MQRGEKLVWRIGVGGPVGSGKTALVEHLVRRLQRAGHEVGVVANDIYTQEDARILRDALSDLLPASRIAGVETGGCPHTAVREDPSANLAAIDALCAADPAIDIVLIESGGDNLTLTFSPALADRSIYVLDVASGDKTPRKQGPGMINADLLVINKIDLAPHVGADLDRMARDSHAARSGPVLFTDCRAEVGIDAVAAWVESELATPKDAIHASAH